MTLLYLSGEYFPPTLEIGNLVLYCTALLFTQTLIRDSYHYFMVPPVRETEVEVSPCICLESSLGIGLLIGGALLLFSGLNTSLEMNPLYWTLSAAATLFTGFLSKDIIIQFQPLRIRRDPEHGKIVLGLKKGKKTSQKNSR